MVYTSDIIKNAKARGFIVSLRNGTKVVRFYPCPKCKKLTKMKFRRNSLSVDACKCGYRKVY